MRIVELIDLIRRREDLLLEIKELRYQMGLIASTEVYEVLKKQFDNANKQLDLLNDIEV